MGIAVILAGAGGYILGKNANLPPRAPTDQELTGRAVNAAPNGGPVRPPQPAVPVSRELLQLLGDPPATEAEMSAAMLRALSEPDPARRSAALGLLLDSMTVANAAAIKQAFIDITVRTGRRHDGEWALMLKKYGATLGKEAVDEWKNSVKDRANAMEGWAMADPEAARLSLDPADPHYAEMRMAVLQGVMGKDPVMGFRLALAEPDAPFYPEWIVQCGIQARGMEGATAALQEVLDNAAPELAHTPAFGQLFGALADAMFFQHWTGGQSEKMLSWLEQQKDQPFVTEEIINHGAKDAVLQGKLAETLDWLDRMGGGGRSALAGYGGLANALLMQPDLLAGVDDPTLDRIVSKLPGDGRALSSLATALEPANPDYAARLRALVPGAP